MFVLEKGKVLKPTSDVVFKNIIKNENNKDFLTNLHIFVILYS